jgi:hypothetical protein
MKSLKSILKSAICLFALCGCGGNSHVAGGSTSAASPGGIWTGTDSSTGMQVTALIAESGQMQVIRSDNAQFFGNLTINGNAISAPIYGIAAFHGAFPDGSIHGTGDVSGTLSARSSITATVTFTTDKGETSTSNVTLAFQSTYLNTQNIAGLAGTYTEANTGAVVTISSDGAIFSQDPNSGCVVNGQINVEESGYSLYAASINYANCQGAYVALNGLEFGGFVDASVLAGFQDKSGKNYGLVYSLAK